MLLDLGRGFKGAFRLLESTDCLNSCAANMYYHNKSNIQVMSGTLYLVCCASNPVVASLPAGISEYTWKGPQIR